MKVANTLAALLVFTSAPSIAFPQPDAELVVSRETIEAREAVFEADISDLWKRKGGGGGGGKGGGGSSGGSSSSGSSAGKGGGSSSSGTGSSSGRGSSSSNAGGQTRTGSGVRPNYGGGRYYGGGATAPYSAGGRSPRGIAPVLLGVGALAILPGLWLYGAYSYPYNNPYTFRNRTGRRNQSATSTSASATATPTVVPRSVNLLEIRQNDGVNETKPVTCLCAQYAVCGCDDSGDTTFLDGLIGDGTYATLNQTLVTVADINGTSTIVLNGTLPNGTTAAGGTEEADPSTTTSGSGSSTTPTSLSIKNAAGYWVMIALVGCTVFLV